MSKKKSKIQNKSKKFKVNDEVLVIAGRDKGKTGAIAKVLSKGRLIVSGINMVVKNVRANPQKNTQGGRQNIEASIHHSNVAIKNPMTGLADRIMFKTLEDGSKARCFKSNGEMLDN